MGSRRTVAPTSSLLLVFNPAKAQCFRTPHTPLGFVESAVQDVLFPLIQEKCRTNAILCAPVCEEGSVGKF